jgi:hypothetical protein
MSTTSGTKTDKTDKLKNPTPANIEEIKHKFFQSTIQGKRNFIDRALRSGALGKEGINIRDMSSPEQFNCLHYAVREGWIKTVEFLLKNGIHKNVRTTVSKETALHIACKLALKKIMTILLKKGANPNLQD